MRTNKIGALVTLVALLALVCLASPLAGANPPAQQGAQGVRVAASVAPLLQYQGRLLDAPTGDPVADGAHTIVFRIYNVETEGAALWTETKDVPVENGLFSTVLGDTTALDHALFNGQALWLGVKVGADPEATPRQPILPVALALGLVPGAVIDGDLTINGALNGGSHTHDGRYFTEGESDGRYVNDDGAEVGDPDVADGALSPAKIAGTAWTGANHGAGSGLDADLLDGQDSSAFAPTSHNHTGADIADGSIGTSDLADGAVTANKLAEGVAPKFINLNPYGAYIVGATFATGYGRHSGIRLADSGTPHFSFGFTIPPDYTPGTVLTLRLIWHTPATSCGIRLRPNFASFARAGRTHIQGASASGGLDAVGGEVLNAPATANESSAKEYTISSPVTGVDLEPGDSVIFGLYRWSANADDTCTDELAIQGIRISYE